MSNIDTKVAIKADTINQSQVNEQLRCSVCHEDFLLSEPVSRLVCDHVFHQSCITPWLERRETCPVCRRVLRESSEPELESDEESFADDEEDDSAVEDDVEQEVVVLNNGVGGGMVTVSVQYRSMSDQQNQTSFQSTITSTSPGTSTSNSDSSVDIFPDCLDLDSPSFSCDSSNIDDTTFDQSGVLDSSSDCDDSHVCFLDLDDTFETDSDMDFTNSFETEDFDFTASPNYLDITIESSMDLENDFI